MVLEKGLLEINGEKVPKDVTIAAKCTDFDGVVLTNFNYITAG